MGTVSGAGRLGSVRTRVERGEALEEARAEEAPCLVASHPDGGLPTPTAWLALSMVADYGAARLRARLQMNQPSPLRKTTRRLGWARGTAPMPPWYGSQCTTEP